MLFVNHKFYYRNRIDVKKSAIVRFNVPKTCFATKKKKQAEEYYVEYCDGAFEKTKSKKKKKNSREKQLYTTYILESKSYIHFKFKI